jgi:hypothetical protein
VAGLCPTPHKLLKKLDQNFARFSTLPRRGKTKGHGLLTRVPIILFAFYVALAGQALLFDGAQKVIKNALIIS